MPNPLIGDADPRPLHQQPPVGGTPRHGIPAQHPAIAEQRAPRYDGGRVPLVPVESRSRDQPRPRGEAATELPPWDLLPPVEFVRRQRG